MVRVMTKRSSEEREREDIASFKRRVFERDATPEEQATYGADKVTGVRLPSASPQLVVERLRRCQNCIHLDQGELFDKRVKDCIRRDNEALKKRGVNAHKRQEQGVRLARAMKSREYGLCLIRDKRLDPGAAGDFQHIHAVCNHHSSNILPNNEASKDVSVEEVFDKAGLSPEDI